MKFYDCQIAPNPRRARIFLAEKGLDIEKVEINIRAGENLTDDFRAINPHGLLPVLQLDDGTCIDEVMAICRYIEELHPEPNLLGRDPKERALITSRQRKAEFTGMLAVSEMFRNSAEVFANRSLPGMDDQPSIPDLVGRGQRTIKRYFEIFESYLADTPFVAGDSFSMADITAFCVIDFAKWVKIEIPENNINMKAWYDKIALRDSASA
ncbi:MAG: glutathione S-transferase family protein [Pseudomonadota bacterium]